MRGVAAGMKTSRADIRVHPLGESMGQVGRVSGASPDPVSDTSRLPSSNDGCPLTDVGHNGKDHLLADAARLFFSS